MAHRAGGRRVSATGAPDAKLYRIPDTEAIEPTLGIDKKGHIYYTAASSATDVDVFKSTDSGKTWTNIVGGIKDNHFTRVVRAVVAGPAGDAEQVAALVEVAGVELLAGTRLRFEELSFFSEAVCHGER